MEIAPIAGVRAASLQQRPKATSASQPPFKIDVSQRSEDDTYSPDRRHSGDTLEEESSVVAQEEAAAPAESMPAASDGSTINVIV